MKKLLFSAALAALLMPVSAAAQASLDGTWKIDMSKVDFPKKPDIYLLQNGMYQCKTCVPPVSVKADGTEQPVSGHPYYDALAVKVVSDHEVETTFSKGGKAVASSTLTISADGNTLTSKFSDGSNTNGGPPVTGTSESTRVSKGVAGSHLVSGSWRTTKVPDLSDNATVWTYKVNGEEITMTTPTGQSYTAKFSGEDAPMKGDPGTTAVSVKMIGKDVFEETDKRDGKVIGVSIMKLTADGKSARLTFVDKLQGTTTTATATKQ